MWRRSSSGSRLVTSSSPMKMRPLVGSIRRLIIFMVVVLPHPDGPTSMTISPAGISMVTLSTAGSADCASYRFVTPSSRILTPPVVAWSDTNPPWDGETGEEVQHGVQDDRQDQDAHRRSDDGVGRVRAAHARDPREDVSAESRPEGVGRDGGDAHQHLRRDSYSGHDHRPCERQFEPHQGREPTHAHAACRFDEVLVDAVQPDDDVAQNREDAE